MKRGLLLVFLLVALVATTFARSQPEADHFTRALLKTRSQDQVNAVVSHSMSNQELQAYIFDFVKRCSNIARFISIGKSVNGWPLYAVSSHPCFPPLNLIKRTFLGLELWIYRMSNAKTCNCTID